MLEKPVSAESVEKYWFEKHEWGNLVEFSNQNPVSELHAVSVEDVQNYWFEEHEWSVLARNALMHKNMPLFYLAFKEAGKYEDRFGDCTLEIPLALKNKGWIAYYNRQCFSSNSQLQACIDIGKDGIHFEDEQGECLHLGMDYILKRLENLHEIHFVLREMGPDFCCAILERLCFDCNGQPVLEALSPIYQELLSPLNLYDYPQLIEWLSARTSLPFGSLLGLLNIFGSSNSTLIGRAHFLRLAPIFIRHSLDSKDTKALNYFQWKKEGIDCNPEPKDETALNQFLIYLVDHFALKGQFNVPFFAAPEHVLLFLLNDDHSGVTGLRNLQPLIIQYLLNHSSQIPEISVETIFTLIHKKGDKPWYCVPDMEHYFFHGQSHDRSWRVYSHSRFTIDMHAHLVFLYLHCFLEKDVVWNWFEWKTTSEVLESVFDKYTQQNQALPEYEAFFEHLSSEIIPFMAEWQKKPHNHDRQDFNYQTQRAVEHTYARIQYWHFLRKSNHLSAILEQFSVKHPGMVSVFYNSLLNKVLKISTQPLQPLAATRAVNHERF